MKQYKALEKRLDKITPLPKPAPVQYIAYWGDDPEAQDTSDFVAVWGDRD